jgi:hypothetical protein
MTERPSQDAPQQEPRLIRVQKVERPPEPPRTVRVQRVQRREGRSRWARLAGAVQSVAAASETSVLWSAEVVGVTVRVLEQPADSAGKRRKRRVHVQGAFARELTAKQATDLSDALAQAAAVAARRRKQREDGD